MSKKRLFCYAFIFMCLSFSYHTHSQERLKYWNDSQELIQDQASLIFEEANNILKFYPPDIEVKKERKLALLSLDALLHDERLDNGSAFKKYMNDISANLVTDLQENKSLGSKIRIFQFYNHGFIIKTEAITIAIDIVRRGKENEQFISDEILQDIVNQCDILFISHSHSDHADPTVAKMFTKQGKKVIVPEKIWEDMGTNLKVLRLKDLKKESININNSSFSIRIYPGYQGSIMNNVYIFTLQNGQTIMHTGDQDYNEDLIKKTKEIKIDALLAHCWLMPMDKFVNGINPSLVITGHHNEVRHTIDHRESYWLTFRRFSEVKVPYIVMAWGESFLLQNE